MEFLTADCWPVPIQSSPFRTLEDSDHHMPTATGSAAELDSALAWVIGRLVDSLGECARQAKIIARPASGRRLLWVVIMVDIP